MFFLGAIFSKNSTGIDEKIFRFAVESISKEEFLSNITLRPVVKHASLDNSFENIYSGKCKKAELFLFFLKTNAVI